MSERKWEATIADSRGRPLPTTVVMDWELDGGRSVYVGARREPGRPGAEDPCYLPMLAEVVIVSDQSTEMDTAAVRVVTPPASSRLEGGLKPNLVPALAHALEKAAEVAQGWEDRHAEEVPF